MTTIPPPFASSRAASIAFGVSTAALVYAISLMVQRFVPSLKTLLAVDLGAGLAPTYYLRVVGSLVAGLIGAWLARRLAIPERRLALGTIIAIVVAMIFACASP